LGAFDQYRYASHTKLHEIRHSAYAITGSDAVAHSCNDPAVAFTLIFTHLCRSAGSCFAVIDPFGYMRVATLPVLTAPVAASPAAFAKGEALGYLAKFLGERE
jgi:hypothetical protein